MPEPDKESYELEWEAFATGKWNGVDITRQHLDEMASNFRKLATNLKVPVKLGHNDKQPMKDGQPMLGTISDVWVNAAGKLMVKAIDMPKVVYEAISKGLYKTTSIEALFDVEYKEDQLGTVLTAVALLGADLPAVNTLDDLQTYLASNSATNDMQFSSRLMFTKRDSEEKSMADDNEIEKLKAKLAAAESKNATLEAEKQEFSTKLESSEAEKARLAFESRKIAAFSRIDKLVAEKKCTPADRDKMQAQYTTENADKLDIKIETIEEMEFKVMSDDSNRDTSRKTSDHEFSNDAQDELDNKIKSFAVEHNISYRDAAERVMYANSKLAREYHDSLDQVEA